MNENLISPILIEDFNSPPRNNHVSSQISPQSICWLFTKHKIAFPCRDAKHKSVSK